MFFKKKAKRSVQERFPLRDMTGQLAVLDDGSKRGYLRLPGRNRSLSTEEQAQKDAYRLADVLSAIRVPFSILKYPQPASSSKHLVQIDRAIERERKKLYEAADDEVAATCRLKMQILEEWMRPDAKAEATSGDRLQWPTYLVLKFDARTSEAECEKVLDTLSALIAEKLGKAPERIETAEFAHLCGLYFTPSSSGATQCLYPAVPMPAPATKRR